MTAPSTLSPKGGSKQQYPEPPGIVPSPSYPQLRRRSYAISEFERGSKFSWIDWSRRKSVCRSWRWPMQGCRCKVLLSSLSDILRNKGLFTKWTRKGKDNKKWNDMKCGTVGESYFGRLRLCMISSLNESVRSVRSLMVLILLKSESNLQLPALNTGFLCNLRLVRQPDVSVLWVSSAWQESEPQCLVWLISVFCWIALSGVAHVDHVRSCLPD